LVSDKGEVLVQDGGTAPLLNIPVNKIKETHISPGRAIAQPPSGDKPKGAAVQLHQVCTVAPSRGQGHCTAKPPPENFFK
jgi:hypothetical protein